MEFQVYINNTLLKNNPVGLESIQFDFIRDNSIYGLYVNSLLNLSFVGDGYSKIIDFIENTDDCELDISIYNICNGNRRNIIDGLIQRGSVKIDYENKIIETEVIDSSPLANISNFSNVTFDYNNTKDIYGNEILIPNYTPLNFFDEYGNYVYNNIETVSLQDMITNMLSFMTGVTSGSISYTSDYFTNANTMEHYRVEYSFAPVSNQVTDVSYTDFYGRSHSFNINLGGIAHLPLVELAFQQQGLGTPTVSPPSVVREQMKVFDYKGFYYTVLDVPNNTIDIYTNVPMYNIVVTTDALTNPHPSVTVTKIDDLVDNVQTPHILNYNMLKGVDNDIILYNMFLNFQTLMTELNKLCNVFFVASYVNGDKTKISFRLENEDFYLSKPPTISLDNVKKLTADFLDDGIYGQITVGSGEPNSAINNMSTTYTSIFCGVEDNFDANSEFVVNSSQIFTDLAATYDSSSTKDTIYLAQATDSNVIDYPLSAGSLDYHTYNMQLNNALSLYRHLSKFNNNLNSSGKSVLNNSMYRLFTKYTFTKSITIDYFYDLIDNLDIRINFKSSDMTYYKTGIIKNITYNYITGEAQFTVLGE